VSTSASHDGPDRPVALSLLTSERPRNVGWVSAAALLFGDWGTSRLYVLGLAFLVAGRTSFWLIVAMSLLILAVAWAYAQICRIYADGGGVYTAGRHRAAVIGVVGALLLFADYTVTASLSAVEAFHYFGLGDHPVAQQVVEDPGSDIRELKAKEEVHGPSTQPWYQQPGFWAIVSIVVIGALNLLGPKHTAGFALFAAGGMIVITLLIVAFALPQLDWRNINFGNLNQPIGSLWYGFVSVVLALSGVEAIANLTGVMKRPVARTASRSIWVVAAEVAVLNLLLALVMAALAAPGPHQIDRDNHTNDMLAHMAHVYVGPWGEWVVRIVAGMLLLSATNTAVGALTGTIYVMSRDGELPLIFQRLNGFGAPWLAAIIATAVPAGVLFVYADLESLASMYAIGIVGAVALNCALTTFHPRLRKLWRQIAMGGLALLLVAIWLTLATTKLHALVFVAIVMTAGLGLRGLTRAAAKRRPKPSLFRQAIVEQLTPEALARPRVMLSTAGSDYLADAAMQEAKADNAALVVCFIRNVALNYRVEAENQLTIDNDLAAQNLFTDFLEHGHKWGVPVIPVYDSGPNSAELIAEHAAMNGVNKVLIGSSRRGVVHQIIKGSFQRRLESLLPPDIPVRVISGSESAPTPTPA
jgi:amino acid transporter